MTDTDINLELFQELNFSETKACELEWHDTSSSCAGPGKWYAVMCCPTCGADGEDQRGVRLICDRFKTLAKMLVDVTKNCHACGAEHSYADVLKIVGEVE